MRTLLLRGSLAVVVECFHIGGEIAKRVGVQMSESAHFYFDMAFWIAAGLATWAMLPLISFVLIQAGAAIMALHDRITDGLFMIIRKFGAWLVRAFKKKDIDSK